MHWIHFVIPMPDLKGSGLGASGDASSKHGFQKGWKPLSCGIILWFLHSAVSFVLRRHFYVHYPFEVLLFFSAFCAVFAKPCFPVPNILATSSVFISKAIV